jgi:hypothetical protein
MTRRGANTRQMNQTTGPGLGDSESNPKNTSPAPTSKSPPTSNNDANGGSGGERETEETGGDNAEDVQTARKALNPEDNTSKNGSALAGLSFRKVTIIHPSSPGNDNSQDEDMTGRGKRRRIGSPSLISTPEPSENPDPLLNYQNSPAPTPPPKTPTAPPPLLAESEVKSAMAFIARLEAKAAKTAVTVPAPQLPPVSENTALFTPRPDAGFSPVHG